MPDWLLVVILVLLASWLLGNILTGPLQYLFIFRPRKIPDDYIFTLNGPFRECWLSTEGGGQINIWWLAGADPSKGIILYFHGNASNLASWNASQDFLSGLGYDLVAFDYRGYGKSKGPRSQELMYRDAEQVYEWLSQQAPGKPIILYGRSMGTTFASRVAAHYSARLLVLETPFSSMKDLFYTYYPFLPRVFFFAFPLPTLDYLRRVTIPVLVFQGTRDRVVPFRNARKLVRVLKKGDTFFRIEGGGHLDIAQFDSYRFEMRKALEALS